MMLTYYRRALQDIFTHRYLNAVTIVTIALSILIASAFVLAFVNANDMIASWEKGIRIMAYLKPGIGEAVLLELKQQIQTLARVQTSRYISKDEALDALRRQMPRQSALFDNLKENPLPDAFEIRVVPNGDGTRDIEALAKRIESIPAIAEVEYGQRWLGQFTSIVNLFRLTGYALAGLFFLAALFIVANTIRLILYSRREEIEVMRLVGATDGFIKAPFYIQGIIQGALGGGVGLTALLFAYAFVSSNIGRHPAVGIPHIRFLPPLLTVGILWCSMFVGWFGCYLSLKQFLKS